MTISIKNEFYVLSSLLLFWILVILLINPIGNFPLNDDWSYAIAVNNFLTTGSFHPTGFTSMTLFSQVIWGSLFGKIFGFSYSVLRISTLVLSFIGLITIYFIARKLTPIRWLAYFMILLVAFNPLFFSLSFTFMTDIPFAVFSIISIFFYIESLQNPSPKIAYFALGTFFAIVSILDRQIGLFIPLAFAIANVVKYGLHAQRLFQSFLSIALTVIILFGFNYWLQISGKTPALYGVQIHDLIDIISSPTKILRSVPYYSFVAIMYIGLFLSPLLIIWYSSNSKKYFAIKKIILLSFVVLSIITIGLYIGKHSAMPYLGNIFSIFGIGPFMLYDQNITGGHYSNFRYIVKFFIMAFSIIGGSILIGFLLSKLLMWKSNHILLRTDKNQIISFFLLIGVLIYLGPLLLIGGFDRYFIIPIMLVGLAIISDVSSIYTMKTKIFSIGIFLIFLSFTIVGTHDYMSRNKVRWTAIENLLNKKIKPSEIDGGFEFNGLYLYDKDYQSMPSKSWWWVHDNKYIIAYFELDGYTAIKKYEYTCWMPFIKNNIFILERNLSSRDIKFEK